ncbi:MAG: hypothetical protein KatS3mg132_453 [Limisphaera sp.]|nr:MAG: hypothetical protein KatS3mg132_453 [Limisphaera sp.]
MTASWTVRFRRSGSDRVFWNAMLRRIVCATDGEAAAFKVMTSEPASILA